jgi:HSP20 family protein
MEVEMARNFLPDVFGRGGGDMFSNLQREIGRVFQEFDRGAPMAGFGEFGKFAMAMKVNVAELDGAVEVTAELPGVAPEDVDVQLKDGILTIKGEKKSEKDDKQKNYHVMERSYGRYERSFMLPGDVDAGKVEAAFDKGVLKVTLPKLPPEKSSVQKIAVKPAA